MRKLKRRAVRFAGLTVGFDLHKRFIRYVILDRSGEEIEGGRIDAHRKALEKFVGKLKGKAQFVMEACGSFVWVYDCLAERVGPAQVHVAQAQRIRAIANSLEKNDCNDAWWLAYLLFEGRLPEAYVAEGRIRELRLAVRDRSTRTVRFGGHDR